MVTEVEGMRRLQRRDRMLVDQLQLIIAFEKNGQQRVYARHPGK